MIKNTLHPSWPMFKIKSNTLCNSDPQRIIMVREDGGGGGGLLGVGRVGVATTHHQCTPCNIPLRACVQRCVQQVQGLKFQIKRRFIYSLLPRLSLHTNKKFPHCKRWSWVGPGNEATTFNFCNNDLQTIKVLDC